MTCARSAHQSQSAQLCRTGLGRLVASATARARQARRWLIDCRDNSQAGFVLACAPWPSISGCAVVGCASVLAPQASFLLLRARCRGSALSSYGCRNICAAETAALACPAYQVVAAAAAVISRKYAPVLYGALTHPSLCVSGLGIILKLRSGPCVLYACTHTSLCCGLLGSS